MMVSARESESGDQVRQTTTKAAGYVFCALLAFCSSAKAQQQANKIPRIGYFSAFDKATEATRAAGLRFALRELGYIEGQNIAIEYRYAETKRDRYPELAADLVRLRVD